MYSKDKSNEKEAGNGPFFLTTNVQSKKSTPRMEVFYAQYQPGWEQSSLEIQSRLGLIELIVNFLWTVYNKLLKYKRVVYFIEPSLWPFSGLSLVTTWRLSPSSAGLQGCPAFSSWQTFRGFRWTGRRSSPRPWAPSSFPRTAVTSCPRDESEWSIAR